MRRVAIDVLVFHAPTGRPGAAAVRRWWKKLDGVLEVCHTRDRPLLCLVDANARLGTVTSESVGAFWHQRQDKAGSLFHDMLRKYKLRVPQTFGEVEEGYTAEHTWESDLLGCHRIDYIALSAAEDVGSQASVRYDTTINGGANDHYLITGALQMSAWATAAIS